MSKDTQGIVQLVDLYKEYDEIIAVDHVNLSIFEGEFLTFLGSSGCGKTTTLRMISGFEEPTSGKILINGQDVHDKFPHERDVNTVFQSYALFPHMDIYNNIAFGLKMKKFPKSEIEKRVTEALDLVQLKGFEKRKPGAMSGGQKQRVAIARALVNRPKVLLLDEPLGALDLKLRKQMQVELKHLQKRLGLTFIYVTHDQEEALTMSDRIAIMNGGKIEQVGTSEEIYENPQTKFVADFIGETNLFDATVVRKVDEDTYLVDIGHDEVNVIHKDLKVGEKILLTVRPERIFLNKFENKENKSIIHARFKEVIYIGSLLKSVFVLENGREVIVTNQAGRLSHNGTFESGEQVALSWRIPQALVVKE
ncbi:MAG: polyamine ABC transporter ATP-binding protein [Vallitaleaceae bacterium]|nr:polyamine ABC transporter ATP-binding protein [Vallitaleaceae bacterium]